MDSVPPEEGDAVIGSEYRLETSEFMIVRHYALMYSHMSKESKHMIEDVVRTVCGRKDAILYPYILRGVTEVRCYCHTLIMSGMPCNKHIYYELRRHFYWELYKRLKVILAIK